MVRIVLQTGHFTLWPAALSGAFNALWHDGQVTEIDMVSPYLMKKVTSFSPIQVGTSKLRTLSILCKWSLRENDPVHTFEFRHSGITSITSILQDGQPIMLE
jgi:hypothetical protein